MAPVNAGDSAHDLDWLGPDSGRITAYWETDRYAIRLRCGAASLPKRNLGQPRNQENSQLRVSPSINQRRHIPRPKPIINIHHTHVRRARIHHPEQRRQPSKRRAVTNAGRDRDHRNAD